MIKEAHTLFHALSDDRKLFYIVLVSLIFYLFYNKSSVFTLLLIVMICGWLLSHDYGTIEAHTDLENEKADFLNTMLYLDDFNLAGQDYIVTPPGINGSYILKDDDLKNIFYQYQDYSNYNLPSYRMALININTLLGIEEFISGNDYCKKQPHQWVESAEFAYREAMNQIHTFVYSLPTTRVQNYLKDKFVKSVDLLLMQHYDNIKNIAKEKFNVSEINIHSKPIHDYYARDNDTKTIDYSPNYSIY